MAVDPTIALSFRGNLPVGPDMNAAMAGAQRAWDVNAAQQANQDRNAIRAIFADPSSMDAQGNPTADATRRVMAVSPTMGMGLRNNMLVQQQHQLQMQQLQTRQFAQQFQMGRDVQESALVAYEEGMHSGLSEPQARAKAQEVMDQGFDALRKGGQFSEQQQSMFPRQFDPAQARSIVETHKDFVDWRRKDEEEARRRADEARREKADRERGWQVLTDPTQKDEQGNPVQYRYHPGTGEATTLDMKPFTPGGAAKVGTPSTSTKADVERDAMTIANAEIIRQEQETGKPLSDADKAKIRQEARNRPAVELQAAKDKLKLIPEDVGMNVARQFVETGNINYLAGFRRSPAMLAQLEGYILKAQQEAGMMPRDVAMRQAQFEAVKQGVKAFEAGGKLEPVVRSQSVAVDHLATLAQAAEALRNGNMQLFNRLSQAVAQQTGSAAPTNFDSLKTIVSSELEKAVTGSAGALGDREALQAGLNRANSSAQLFGTIGEYQKLMAGQLSGLRRTYDRLETGKNFDERYLSPQARREVARLTSDGGGTGGSATGPPKITDDDAGRKAFEALKKGDLYVGPDGQSYRKK